MIAILRRLAATALAAFVVALPASAGTTFSTDFTDLWWNPDENGWGVNVIQQHQTLFATLFVYGADGSARWYVASELNGSGTTFTGTLYQTSGPPFSGAFNPSAVSVTPVGSMTFAFSGANSGTLTYSVSGQTVTKSIQRQSFRTQDLSGRYVGGMTAVASGCSNSQNNGDALMMGDVSIGQSGNGVSIIVDWFIPGTSTTARCTFNGTLTPQGRLGSLSGTWSCSGGATNSGSFTMSEVDASRNGFHARLQGNDQFCSSYSGWFGGVRDVR